MSAGRHLSDISLNRTMALYDAAALTLFEPSLPEQAVRAAMRSRWNGDLLRQMGIFPPELAVSGDAAPGDRFLAYIGRQPRDRSVPRGLIRSGNDPAERAESRDAE